MRWAIQPGDSPLFGTERGCDQFEQRVLHFDDAGAANSSDTDDEVLYVLSGAGELDVAGERVQVSTGAAVYVPRGRAWRVVETDELELLSVLVREPVDGDGAHAVIAAEDAEEGSATAGRRFRLLATPERGCATVTQFVGFIPVGRAPDHYHRYDEVVYVLQGTGALHIDGETAPLQAGSCVHLPAGLVHCLENQGPGEMHVLGVFRPAGSPAEAYYPDGTKAEY